MVTRHRIPTIFTLSMVDVLCCALGCVILLWLLNLREAKQRAAAAGEASQQLALTRTRLDETGQRLRDAERLRDQAGADLRAARARQAELDKHLADLRNRSAAAEDRLAKKVKELASLSKDLAGVRQRAKDLDMLVRQRESQAQVLARKTDDLTERLQDADARAKLLRSQVDQLPGLRDEAQAVRDRLAASETRAQILEKDIAKRRRELTDAGRAITNLEDEKKSLTDLAVRARAAADNRFAGVTLTGRRVIFLVDMSGSMKLVDDNTVAPDKWPGVRQTLTKIMRSLPDLEKFQVILFSTKATYLLGNEGRWLDYDSVASSSRVAQALAAIDPAGNTDMYTAFDEAFRFRRDGLDTIYIFSDGLPNVGAGLTPEAARTLKEADKVELLGRHVRQTLRTTWNRPGPARVRINAVGFFFESPEVGAFLWALARENDGSFVGMSKP